MSIKITERQECQRFVLDKPDEQNTLLNSYILHNNYIKLNFTQKKKTHTHRYGKHIVNYRSSFLFESISIFYPTKWIMNIQKTERRNSWMNVTIYNQQNITVKNSQMTL